MVIEYIRYRIDASRRDEFERAYAEGSRSLETSSHCLTYEVGRGVEDPESYIVRIEWDSVEGHEQGFRKSPEFGEFFAAVKPFFDDIQEMRHYEAIGPTVA
ncbi:MAG: antibiotic biosynthesis monooxygenase [Actinobacteria bacterium]|nr:antibiotic biosynthesis monooxygenase [Actinomycetota bacterium]